MAQGRGHHPDQYCVTGVCSSRSKGWTVKVEGGKFEEQVEGRYEWPVAHANIDEAEGRLAGSGILQQVLDLILALCIKYIFLGIAITTC